MSISPLGLRNTHLQAGPLLKVTPQGLAFPVHPETANRFLERSKQGQGDAMESVGLGVDIRYAGSAGVLGSCLLHESEVIHASFFPGT